MDPPSATAASTAVHHQDPAAFIFQQAQYALQQQSQDSWSSPAFSPPQDNPHHAPPTSRNPKSKPYARPATHNPRLTRTRAAALAKQSEDSAHDADHLTQHQPEHSDHPQEHHQPPQLQSYPPAPPYTPSGYLNTNDDSAPSDGSDALATTAQQPQQPYTTPSAVYQHHYHLNFPADVPTSPSPPNSSSSGGPNHPPLHAHQIHTPAHHSPLGFSAAASAYHPQMMLPGRVDGYPQGGLDDSNTVYGSSGMSRGTEIMRVPSASPSIASGDIGSPAPDDYHGHARSASSHYDYSGSGGPISPLSSSYAPQPLPSTFSSVTGGYLHGPPSASQSALPPSTFPSTASPTEADALPASSASSRGRAGQKTKTKLTDMDRKFICVFAQNHPKARQEDIATKFAVERSTVSKILKCKEKWMKVDFFSSEARVVKHRPSKFPELESTLIHHIRMRMAAREPVNDSFIKKMALELADERGIGRDKFKASSGWVENFKHRHDLRKGGSWGAATRYAQQSATPAVPATIGQSGGGDGDYGGDGGPLVYPGDDDVSGEYAEEESNPLDEAMQRQILRQQPRHEGSIGGGSSVGFDEYARPGAPASSYAHSDVSTSLSDRGPPSSLIVGFTSSSPSGAAHARGLASSLQVNTATAMRQGPPSDAGRLGSISPHQLHGGQSFLHHQHLATPRSISRSTSSASIASLAASSANGSRFSPTSGSPPNFPFNAAMPPSPVPSHFHGHGPGHGHRRSMSASYTASPLSVEVGIVPLPNVTAVPASPAGAHQRLVLEGSSLRPGAANRRSVTFSSFSAMAAGLSLSGGAAGSGSPRMQVASGFGDDLQHPAFAHYPSGHNHGHGHGHGHGRSLSQGSAGGKIQVPLPVYEEQHLYPAQHGRTQSTSTSSTLVHSGPPMGHEKSFSAAVENVDTMMGYIDTSSSPHDGIPLNPEDYGSSGTADVYLNVTDNHTG